MDMRSGTRSTPAAFSVSQKSPSLVPALPIVAKQISSPFLEKPLPT